MCACAYNPKYTPRKGRIILWCMYIGSAPCTKVGTRTYILCMGYAAVYKYRYIISFRILLFSRYHDEQPAATYVLLLLYIIIYILL